MNGNKERIVAMFLHENIPEGNIEIIKSFLMEQELVEDERYLNEDEESAAAVAIKSGRFDVYELLVSFGIFLSKHENMRELFANQPSTRKIEIREIHKKFFKAGNLKHLHSILSQCRLSHDESEENRKVYAEYITAAFEEINDIKSIEPILKVVSTSPDLRIVFDFNNDSVESLDPTKSSNVLGVVYPYDAFIFIGAKGLTEEKKQRREVLGTLSHELCHFAMHLLYNNKCKPFAEDLEKEKKFENILQETWAHRNDEPIINMVYDYGSERQQAELIVRIPHLIALKGNNDNEIARLSKVYKELFQFYMKNTKVDLEREYPLMKSRKVLIDMYSNLTVLHNPNIDLTREGSNIDLNTNEQFLVVSSNCCQLTMFAINKLFSTEMKFGSIVLTHVKAFQTDERFNYAVDTIRLCTKPKLIIDCSGQRACEVEKIFQKFRRNHIEGGIVFISEQNLSLEIPSINVKHLWNHLTKDFQKTILERKVNFQGKDIKIGDLLKDQWINSIDLFPFKEILSENTVEICKPKPEENASDFVQRKFLTSDSKENTSRKDNEGYDIIHDINDLLHFAEENKTFLLFDEPGMGKSSTFKMIQSELRIKYPFHWVVFIDLKQHWRIFETDNKITIHFSNCDIISTFLTDKILKIGGFEAQIFSQLFKFGQVIILMDGLDEMSPTYKKFIFSLMIAIQAFSMNQLWISSRPHLRSDVENDLNPITFKLQPFTEENRKEFFVNFFTAKGNGNQNIAEKMIDINSFFVKIQREMPGRFISNPLMFTMIAECFDDDENLKLSFSYLFSIFDQFTKKMIKRTMNLGIVAQGSVANTVGESSIMKFYQKEAFQICFKGDAFVEGMIDLCFKHVDTPSFEDIIRVGLMFSNGSGSYYFIHKTFAEFFVAKFFYEMLFLRKHQQDEPLKPHYEIDVLCSVLKNTNDEHQMITILLDNALKSFVVEKSLEGKGEPTLIERKFSKEIDYNVLETLIEGGHFNLVKTLLLDFSSKPRELVSKSYKDGTTLIMTAVRIQSIDFNKQFFDCVETILDKKEIRELLSKHDRQSRNIFHFSNENAEHPGVHNFLKEKVEVLIDQNFLISLLGQKDKSNLNFSPSKKPRLS